MIKITNAALDERENQIILRGVIDPDSLEKLLVADYQREARPSTSLNKLADAIRKGSGVPDIQLGMRGGSFQDKNDSFYLADPVYIIDGLQRSKAAMKLLQGGATPRLGCSVYFNTTEDSERAMFKSLNMEQVKLSPNILLRNEATESVFVDMLIGLCKDSTFALKGRVCWQQSMQRDQLLTAATLMRVTSALHKRFGGGDRSTHTLTAAKLMDSIVVRLRRSVLRENVRLFFNTVDELWSIREITYKERAPYIRSGFLLALAGVFSSHEDFWEDTRLVVSPQLKKKLGSFPITDPAVAQLAGSMGAAQKILFRMIVDHINSGKRHRRLTPKGQRPAPAADDDEIEPQLASSSPTTKLASASLQ